MSNWEWKDRHETVLLWLEEDPVLDRDEEALKSPD
jgi:hypothetical protein